MSRSWVLFYEFFAVPVKEFAKKRQSARDFPVKGAETLVVFWSGGVLLKKQPLVFRLYRRYNEGENTPLRRRKRNGLCEMSL